MAKTLGALCVLILFGFLGACAQQYPQKLSTKLTRDHLPHIDISAWGVTYNTDNEFEDKYTRILIMPISPEDSATPYAQKMSVSREAQEFFNRFYDRIYANESRNWMRRWLAAKTVSEVFVVSFDLNDDATKFSTELFSLSFDSSSVSGETWSTSQGLNFIVSPYFKVSAGDTLGMDVSLSLSEDTKSEVSTNVVGTLTAASSAIAPDASLVTTLSSERISKASQFLDERLGALFDKSITESLKTDIQLDVYCKSGGFVASIFLSVPDIATGRITGPGTPAGAWIVFLESPVDSVFTKNFSATRQCPDGEAVMQSVPDFRKLQTGDVLEFKISDDLTIYDYVFSRLELMDNMRVLNEKASSRFGQATTEEDLSDAAEAARLICARLERKLPALGLNTFDTAATLWAVSNSDQFNADARELLLDPETCNSAGRWSRLELKPAPTIVSEATVPDS